jgi:WD40 repeat protein
MEHTDRANYCHLSATDEVRGAVFSPDGTTVLTASADGTARLWDVVTGKELLRLEGHTEAVNRAAFSPDGKYIVTASWDGTAGLGPRPERRKCLPIRSCMSAGCFSLTEIGHQWR